jgi:acetyl-CoA acyltransferase
MTAAVIVDVIRTASGKGKPGGQPSGIHPADLLSRILRTLVERNDIAPELIEDVIGGCASQAGQQACNITRCAVLGAGLPETIPATTIDRRCGSSQQAAHFAAQGVLTGAYDVVIACGIESMSRVPLGSTIHGEDPFGPAVAARYPDGLVSQACPRSLSALPESWIASPSTSSPPARTPARQPPHPARSTTRSCRSPWRGRTVPRGQLRPTKPCGRAPP